MLRHYSLRENSLRLWNCWNIGLIGSRCLSYGVGSDHPLGDINDYKNGYNPDGATNTLGSLNLLLLRSYRSLNIPLYLSTICVHKNCTYLRDFTPRKGELFCCWARVRNISIGQPAGSSESPLRVNDKLNLSLRRN